MEICVTKTINLRSIPIAAFKKNWCIIARIISLTKRIILPLSWLTGQSKLQQWHLQANCLQSYYCFCAGASFFDERPSLQRSFPTPILVNPLSTDFKPWKFFTFSLFFFRPCFTVLNQFETGLVLTHYSLKDTG